MKRLRINHFRGKLITAINFYSGKVIFFTMNNVKGQSHEIGEMVKID